jgi:hypothetical protein
LQQSDRARLGIRSVGDADLAAGALLIRFGPSHGDRQAVPMAIRTLRVVRYGRAAPERGRAVNQRVARFLWVARILSKSVIL